MQIGSRTGSWASSGVDWEGQTVLTVSIPSGGFEFAINTVSPSSCKIDWGDGTIDTLRRHSYAEGDYTIKIDKKCTSFYLAWGSSSSQRYVTGLLNIGIGLTKFNYEQLSFNGSLPLMRVFGTVDCPPLTDITYMTKDFGNLTDWYFPDGFGSNATNVHGAMNGIVDSAVGKDIVLPTGFGYVASTTELCCGRVRCKSIKFPDGFGRIATNINSTVNTQTYVGSLQRVEFPEFFGANANESTCKFIQTANSGWEQTALTDLVMHGRNNGIRYSQDLHLFKALNVTSAVSVMRSLQPISDGMATQTLTLPSRKRSEYEASHDFIDEASDFVLKGWSIAYS